MFQLEIVTPEKMLVRDTVEGIQLPGKDGYLGVLPGHAPLITELAIGEIAYRKGSTVTRLAVAWGFAEVLPDRVTVLAETAERPQDIDIARAQQAWERAQAELKKAEMREDYERALAQMQRAETRLSVAKGDGAMANIVP